MDSSNDNPMSCHPYGSTKKFFLHTLEHLTTNNIITPYTRDKLTDMINSEAKKDFAKVRKHVMDIMSLHDTFDEVANSFQASSSNPISDQGSDEKKKTKRKK